MDGSPRSLTDTVLFFTPVRSCCSVTHFLSHVGCIQSATWRKSISHITCGKPPIYAFFFSVWFTLFQLKTDKFKSPCAVINVHLPCRLRLVQNRKGKIWLPLRPDRLCYGQYGAVHFKCANVNCTVARARAQRRTHSSVWASVCVWEGSVPQPLCFFENTWHREVSGHSDDIIAITFFRCGGSLLSSLSPFKHFRPLFPLTFFFLPQVL